jgi:hypothetical protein
MAKTGRTGKVPAADETAKVPHGSDAHEFAASAGLSKKIVKFRRDEVVLTQGGDCDSVVYIEKGGVKLIGALENRAGSGGRYARPGRSRVNFFMNQFKKLGFIEHNGNLADGIQNDSWLLSVVLHD